MLNSPPPPPDRRRPSPFVLLLLSASLAVLAGPARGARGDGLGFREQSLELPGAPAALVPADLDGDGVQDLAVVVVYTEWDQIGIEEWTEMDQVEGLVEVLTIVPVLFDRREVRAYLGRPGGGFEAAGEPLPLPLSVLSLEGGRNPGRTLDYPLPRVEDLDGDGLPDLLFRLAGGDSSPHKALRNLGHPQKVEEPGVTPPVRLDLYLTGGPAGPPAGTVAGGRR